MGTLQDALLKTGLADESQVPKRKGPGSGKPGKSDAGSRGKGGAPDQKRKTRGKGKPKGKGSAGQGKSDLERAWAARHRAEKQEKERIKKERVADQEARRKRNLELDALVEGKVLNHDDAEVPRYFEHIGRIRRVLCTPEQRDAINAGDLVVVGLRGRYLIVDAATGEAYREKAPDLVPDLGGAEPDGEEGDYPPVPDDVTG